MLDSVRLSVPDGIRIEGLPELQKIMKEIGSLRPVIKGLGKAALHVKGKIADPPRVSRRPVAQFWTDKQRRGFFYHLNAGNIEVPYVRRMSKGSEDLGHSWTVRSGKGGLEWKVGNDSSYGPLVQDRDRQARYHRDTGWITTQKVAEDEADTASEIVKKQVDAALEGRNA